MTIRYDQRQQYQEARQFASDYGMFIVEKSNGEKTRYLVYRRAKYGSVFLGYRGSIPALRKFVEDCSTCKTSRKAA